MAVKILLVDDDLIDLEFLKRLLKNGEHELIVANNGFEALELIKNNSDIKLVLMDGIMPGLSGFETCKKIQTINDELPVILVTGLTDEKFLKQAFDCGAVDFISKPPKKLEVLSRINNILKIRDAKDEIKKLYDSLVDDLKLAGSVQSYLISDWINIKDSIAMSSSYIPCSTVSGDLFDFIPLNDEKNLIYIGDISGHGIQASLMMAAIQVVIQLEVLEHKNDIKITRILQKLNTVFSEKFPSVSYMTFLIGVLDKNKQVFEYFSAGHPPIIAYNIETGSAQTNSENGSLPIGMFSDTVYSESDIDILNWDQKTAILLYSDGLFEISSPQNNDFNIDSLLKKISNTTFSSLFSLTDELIASLKKDGYQFDDDVTILFLHEISKNQNITTSTIANELNKIRPSVENICLELKEAKIPEEIINAAEILITEHLNNIVIHGKNQNDYLKTENIFLSVNLNGRSLVIHTLDKGGKWNNHSNIAKNDNNKTLTESGRGLEIINIIAHGISYKRFDLLNETIFSIDMDKFNIKSD